MRTRSLRAATSAAVVGATALAGYAIFIRPWLRRWGATDEEARERLPGDDVVKQPRYQATHAVTIHAPIDRVWPWLVQIGQGRGGFYSYEVLENLVGCDIHNADRIVPEWQDLEVGDEVWLVPKDSSVRVYYQVLEVQPPHVLVLGPHGDPREAIEQGLPWPSWAFVMREVGEESTRLIVRTRHDFKPDLAGLLVNKYGMELAHFVMERKMLLGIKQRAQRH